MHKQCQFSLLFLYYYSYLCRSYRFASVNDSVMSVLNTPPEGIRLNQWRSKFGTLDYILLIRMQNNVFFGAYKKKKRFTKLPFRKLIYFPAVCLIAVDFCIEQVRIESVKTEKRSIVFFFYLLKQLHQKCQYYFCFSYILIYFS